MHTWCPTKQKQPWCFGLAFFSYTDKTSLATFASKLKEGKVLLHCFCKSSLQGRFWQWITSSCKQLAQTCRSWRACKDLKSTLKCVQLGECNMLCIWSCCITSLMILSLYSLKLEAAPTVVSGSHITEETENLVMYFKVGGVLFSNIGPKCSYRAKYLYNNSHVFLCKGKWNLITSVFQSNQE